MSSDIVHRPEQAGPREPLLVLDQLEAFLDSAGLGAGPIQALPIGEGHSNVTYLLQREKTQLVLRRPPRGPLPPSAHDVLREARLLRALEPLGVRVPRVLSTCGDETVIGAPFYVMSFVEGVVFTTHAPPEQERLAVGEEIIDALVELHAIDALRPELNAFGRPGSYLERQINRFATLLETNATRALPDLERVADWLASTRPTTQRTTIVHGDYRLGNVMYSRTTPRRLAAVLDWELASIGDPLADLGYLTATWASYDDAPNPMVDLAPATRSPGFHQPNELASIYGDRTGSSLDALHWYQALALWKAAIFLEGSYKRYREGTTSDRYFASLEEGVPLLARHALAITSR